MNGKWIIFSRVEWLLAGCLGVILAGSLHACAGPSNFERGEQAAKKGDWEKAVSYYERAYRLDPRNREVESALLGAMHRSRRDAEPSPTTSSSIPPRSESSTVPTLPVENAGIETPGDREAASVNPPPLPSSLPPVNSPSIGMAPGLVSGTGIAPIAQPSSGSLQPGGLEPSGQTAQTQPAIVSVIPPSGPISVGQEFNVQVVVSNVDNLFAAPFYFYYNPANFTVETVTEGSFLNQDGMGTAFLKSVDPSLGRVIVGLTRLGAVPGVGGSGTLATVTFKALAPGQASLTLANVDFEDPELRPVAVQVHTGVVEVR